MKLKSDCFLRNSELDIEISDIKYRCASGFVSAVMNTSISEICKIVKNTFGKLFL
jgi:hypothetical protein